VATFSALIRILAELIQSTPPSLLPPVHPTKSTLTAACSLSHWLGLLLLPSLPHPPLWPSSPLPLHPSQQNSWVFTWELPSPLTTTPSSLIAKAPSPSSLPHPLPSTPQSQLPVHS
jgi:hypothetical protein